ncbi:MAG TPA: glycosyltransferase family 39 protein [Acidobacteriaceae bacterium]|jgi:hypothetical protein|nr:glycosyltransferase family 39 protein [Acidobacteriaceae bacterium]
MNTVAAPRSGHPSGELRSETWVRLSALALVLLTAVLAVVWSHVKLLSQDEIFVLQTDTVSSLRELIHIQRHFPISLDPLIFHLLAHAATRIFGPSALALRLPAILGFLLMQVCLFLATRRIAGAHAALVALAFPALTATLFYAPEARPYGLLLGLYALTFLAWQTATRAADPAVAARAGHSSQVDPRPPRTGTLVLLAIAIALTLNTHYFGILLLAPLCLAELVRTVLRRRLDLPVVAAIVLGMTGILGALPFQRAAGEFRKHYYNAGGVNFHAITQSYRALFVSYTDQSIAIQQIAIVLLSIAAAVLVLAVILALRKRTVNLPSAELAFLLTLAALPLFGFLIAFFVTHSIEVRYVLGAIVAIAIFAAIALAPWLRPTRTAQAIAALLFVGVLLGGFVRIRSEQRKSTAVLASLILAPELKARLLALPDSHLYLQNMGHFEVASYYEPDPEVRSRLALLHSREAELQWDRHDTASLTAEHMQHFTGFRIVPYAELQRIPGEHMLVLFHSGWDWTDQALASGHASISPLGPALDGDAVAVQFLP